VLNKGESGQREDNTGSELGIFTRSRKEERKKGSGILNYPSEQQFISIYKLTSNVLHKPLVFRKDKAGKVQGYSK